jgi:hypothetical protein
MQYKRLILFLNILFFKKILVHIFRGINIFYLIRKVILRLSKRHFLTSNIILVYLILIKSNLNLYKKYNLI